ncbi:MAG: CBS domain-containing protein [Actinomycetota bacterium]
MSRIDQHMNRFVLTVGPEETLEQGAQAMMERKVGSAVVVKGGSNIGIVTERDVLRAVARGTVPWSTKISEVMTTGPVSIPPHIDTAEATQLMLENGFRHLPVVEEGALVGIVSLRDLLVAAYRPMEATG